MLDIEAVARAVAGGPRTILHPRAAAGQRAAVAVVFAGATGGCAASGTGGRVAGGHGARGEGGHSGSGARGHGACGEGGHSGSGARGHGARGADGRRGADGHRGPDVRGHVSPVVGANAGADGLNLCLIRRATHPRDPWSGQMAFPGGRVAPEDAAAVDAAIRETREEVGLDLTGARRLGALPEIPLVGRGRPLGGVVAPFAFYAGAELPEFRIDPAEVATAYWIELSYLRDPCHRTTLEREVSGTPRQLPAIRFQDTLIWGMTYRILTALLEAIEADPIAAERAW